MASRVLRLRFFTKSECSLCDTAVEKLQVIQKKVPFELEYVYIDRPENEHWRGKYKYEIPVVHINDQLLFKGIMDPASVESKLVEAMKKLEALGKDANAAATTSPKSS